MKSLKNSIFESKEINNSAKIFGGYVPKNTCLYSEIQGPDGQTCDTHDGDTNDPG